MTTEFNEALGELAKNLQELGQRFGPAVTGNVSNAFELNEKRFVITARLSVEPLPVGRLLVPYTSSGADFLNAEEV